MSEADREKWDARYGADSHEVGAAPAWLDGHDSVLPRAGRALDVASGSGRIALWAAARGLDVTALDISSLGLAKMHGVAGSRGLSVDTVERDLEIDPRLPLGPFTLVTCFHYRQPALVPAMRTALEVGGVLVIEALTVVNLERHAHPSRRWLAEPGEVRSWAEGLEVISYEEGWSGERHSARLLARRSDVSMRR